MAAILVVPAKLATLDLFKIKLFQNKGYDDINKNLLRDSNYIVFMQP